jgi:hypothetical protein
MATPILKFTKGYLNNLQMMTERSILFLDKYIIINFFDIILIYG